MAESFLNRIIQSGTPPTPSGYVRLAGVPDGESIIANAPVIESGGVNYYPIYYMCLMDTLASESFTKTGTGVASGADAYVFSDDLSNFYVGDTTHTFDVSQDSETSENWKCRYVIAYATEANATDANGIHISMYSYKNALEFIGSQYLKLKSTSVLFGSSSLDNHNLRYLNLSNSSFKDNTIASSFCENCYTLQSLLLPYVSNIRDRFCRYCGCLKSLSLPYITALNYAIFCQQCYSLKYFKISNTVTSITNTSSSFLNYTQFIELPTNFDIDACNFTGATGYTKSLAWFTHLATQLKDNSGGTAKTMVLGAANIALIPTDTATIISNKNWTLS